MNQIQPYEQQMPAHVIRNDRQNAGVDAIRREVDVIEDASRVVPILVDGGMAPAIYTADHQPRKNGPAQGRDMALAKAMAAAIYGATLGFGVAKSLQNVFTVHGQPSIYARTAVALVLSYGHKIWTQEAGPTSVTVCGQRRGSDQIETSTWNIERATQAGFTSNAKYKSQPEEMLYAKAAMTVCRRAFPDVMEGIPYSTEELELEPVKMQATRTDAAPAGRGRAGLAAALNPAPAPAGVVEDALSVALSEVAAESDRDALQGIVEAYAARLDEGEHARLSDEARARWTELAAAQMDDEHDG